MIVSSARRFYLCQCQSILPLISIAHQLETHEPKRYYRWKLCQNLSRYRAKWLITLSSVQSVIWWVRSKVCLVNTVVKYVKKPFQLSEIDGMWPLKSVIKQVAASRYQRPEGIKGRWYCDFTRYTSGTTGCCQRCDLTTILGIPCYRCQEFAGTSIPQSNGRWVRRRCLSLYHIFSFYRLCVTRYEHGLYGCNWFQTPRLGQFL